MEEILQIYKGKHNFLSFTISDPRYKELSRFEKTIMNTEIIELKHELYEDV